MTPRLALGPELFTIFAYMIEERTGIHYRPDDRELLSDKIAWRAAEAGFDSGLEYYYALRYDDPNGAELDALIDALVVNETYFFREADAIRTVIDVAIRPVVQRGGRARVWSAACSTGEEPLTIAMMLDEAGLADAVEVVATDISRRALAIARRGAYRARSFRALPSAARDRWFRLQGDDAIVAPHILGRVDFRRLNLLDAAAVAGLGTFDAVFCRNVFIYFGDPTIVRVVDAIARALRARGVLAVGAAESLLRFGTLLRCEEHGGTFLYRSVQ